MPLKSPKLSESSFDLTGMHLKTPELSEAARIWTDLPLKSPDVRLMGNANNITNSNKISIYANSILSK